MTTLVQRAPFQLRGPQEQGLVLEDQGRTDRPELTDKQDQRSTHDNTDEMMEVMTVNSENDANKLPEHSDSQQKEFTPSGLM